MTAHTESLQCATCGASNRGGAKFCTRCGADLIGALPVASTVRSLPAPTRSSNLPAGVEDVAETLGATFNQVMQDVTGFVRDILPSRQDAISGPLAANPDDAGGDDYGLGLKPVSGKATNIGKTRQVNEDSLIAFEFTKVQEGRGVPIGFYMVADGMGGHQAGEIASRTVNKVVTEKVINAQVVPGLAFATRKLGETPEAVLKEAVKQANQTLFAQAQAQQSNMGTTLTAVLIIGNRATIANVGDSRTYLLRDGALRQVTQDHSLVAGLVAAGIVPPDQARSHPQRNQVYRTLGIKADVEVDIFTETMARGDRLVLCSDGLWEEVVDADVARIVAKARSPQQACQALVRRAIAAGGQDNITVIVVNME